LNREITCKVHDEVRWDFLLCLWQLFGRGAFWWEGCWSFVIFWFLARLFGQVYIFYDVYLDLFELWCLEISLFLMLICSLLFFGFDQSFSWHLSWLECLAIFWCLYLMMKLELEIQMLWKELGDKGRNELQPPAFLFLAGTIVLPPTTLTLVLGMGFWRRWENLKKWFFLVFLFFVNFWSVWNPTKNEFEFNELCCLIFLILGELN